MKKISFINVLLPLLACVIFWSLPAVSGAHCDTLNGPVVNTARIALEKGDVTPVLKWVPKKDEDEISGQFQKTLAARRQGKEAKELADRYFFETLVRIHRAGEGAPYAGLKPAGEVEPSVAAADKAIETGSVDSLVKMMKDSASSGIRERFARVTEARKHADESVAAGRKFVKTYVDFTHYVEKLHMAASGSADHREEAMHQTPDQAHPH